MAVYHNAGAPQSKRAADCQQIRDRLSHLGFHGVYICESEFFWGEEQDMQVGQLFSQLLPSHRPTSLVEMVAYLATLRATKSEFLSGAHPVQLQMARTCNILSGYTHNHIPIASIHVRVLDNVAHQRHTTSLSRRRTPLGFSHIVFFSLVLRHFPSLPHVNQRRSLKIQTNQE